MYSAITKNIRVSIMPEHLVESSDPNDGIFAFSYTVTIENLGDSQVQLLERHWIINSGGGEIAEIVGPGVVGEQPVLDPGEAFQYTSGAVIQDPCGAMEGSYTFQEGEGMFFEVGIPRFDLLYPLVIH